MMCKSHVPDLVRRECLAGSTLALSFLPASLCRAAEAVQADAGAETPRPKKSPAVVR